MEFTFIGEKIIIDNKYKEYMELLESYYEIAVDFQDRWKDGYYAADSTKERVEMFEKGYNKFYNALVNKTLELLDERADISDIDRKTFNSYYQEIIGISSVREKIDLIKGVLDCRPSMDKYYYDYIDAFSYWKEKIRKDALAMIDVYAQICVDKKGSCPDYIYEKEHEEVKNILNVINQEHIEKSELESALCRSMQIYPFEQDIYFQTIYFMGDDNKEIEKIAKTFFVDSECIKFRLIWDEMKDIRSAFEEEQNLELDEWINLKERVEEEALFCGYEFDKVPELVKFYNAVEKIIEESNKNLPAESGKKFEFLNYDITISEVQIVYNEILKAYRDEAKEQVHKLKERYLAASNLDTVAKEIENWGTELLTETAEKMLDSLGQQKIYTIDINILNEKYSAWIDFDTWRTALEEFAEKCVECVYSEEQMKVYREQRKNYRGRFVGGGFGISGAIKGSMKAGALNMATGAAHSVINTIGNMNSDAKIRANKKRLYERSDTINALCEALYTSVLSIHTVFTRIIWEETHVYIGKPDKIDVDKANAINNSIKAGRYQGDIRRALAESLCLNVYNEDTYVMAIQYYGDTNGAIAQMAEFFMIDINKIKEKMVIEFLRDMQYDLISLKTPKDMVSWEERRRKIKEKEEWLGYKSKYFTEAYEFIEKEMLIADAYFRIANGKIYSTAEEANAVKLDLSMIYEIVDNMELSEEDMKQKVTNLELNTEEISNNRHQFMENRRKLKSADAEQVEKEIMKIRAEKIQLPHKENEDSMSTITMERYLKDRYFDKNSIKYREMLEKVKKVIFMSEGEEMAAFITRFSGVVFNDIGLVITNKKLYFIERKKILFQSEWSFVDKILVQEDKYVIYTTDSKIFSHKMDDIDSEYICNIMNAFFEEIVSMFLNIYPKSISSERNIKKLEVNSEVIISYCNQLKENIYQYMRDNSVYVSNSDAYFYGEADFLERVNEIKVKIGSNLVNEIPLLLCDTSAKTGYKMLLTNKIIYWYDKDEIIDSMEIEDIANISIKGKTFLFEKAIAEMKDGMIKTLPVIELYLTKVKYYIAMLNMAREIVKKINSLMEDVSE